MLYEIALVQKPTKKQSEDGELEKLILGPIAIIARDEKSAGVQAVMKHRNDLPENLADVEVLVRPFC